MKNQKEILIGCGIAVVLLGIYMYKRKPVGNIVVNADGTGTVQLGSKIAMFGVGESATVKSWNGWSLTGSATNYTFNSNSYSQSGNITSDSSSVIGDPVDGTLNIVVYKKAEPTN